MKIIVKTIFTYDQHTLKWQKAFQCSLENFQTKNGFTRGQCLKEKDILIWIIPSKDPTLNPYS